jgi:hypothetical protein
MEMELIELLEKGNGKHANHEEDEEGPTCWDTTDIKFLEVSKDKLTVKYHLIRITWVYLWFFSISAITCKFSLIHTTVH